MPSRRTNNFPESGRGLGHVSDVTPTIFGSTVGYPSDSLTSCIAELLGYYKASFRVHTVSIKIDIFVFLTDLSVIWSVTVLELWGAKWAPGGNPRPKPR